MRSLFVPYHTGNPYQSRLASGLKAHGVEVSGSDLKGLLLSVLRRRDSGPGIIHLHWLPRVQLVPAPFGRLVAFCFRIAALRVLGVKFVWTVHNLYSHEGKFLTMERHLARFVAFCCTKIIVHSQAAKEQTAAEFDVVKDKIVVIPHGNYVGSYDNQIAPKVARDMLHIPKESIVFLFFGNIRPYKGILELLAAYAKVRGRRTMLLIAGRPIDQETRDIVERETKGFDDVVTRLEFIPDADVQIYMHASDVVVFPYLDVLTSGAIVLAMSFGRACIAPAIGCIPDILDDQGGFLYKPTEDSSLVEAMNAAIFVGHERLVAMGQYNLNRALDWDWSQIGRETADVYAAV